MCNMQNSKAEPGYIDNNTEDTEELNHKTKNMNSYSTEAKSGYDLPVYGLENDTFYAIHIPAICCIMLSLICAIIAVALSFRLQSWRGFFKTWSKSERFIVYLAVCDGSFNVSHFTDHMHIVIVRNHVYPRELCEFYGFMLAEFVTAQNLMVNCVAINAFMLIFFDRHLDFGRYDWKLLLWTFGAPFVGATIAGAAGKLGPNGVFCYFDTVKGEIANISFTTVPLVLILVINTVLYILTWKRIHDQSLLTLSTLKRASHRAAKAMSLFVAAFFIQWWAMALFGIWGIASPHIPQALFHLVVTFSNIGGILNLIVFIVMRRKGLARGEHLSTRAKSSKEDANANKGTSNEVQHTQDISLTLDDFTTREIPT